MTPDSELSTEELAERLARTWTGMAAYSIGHGNESAARLYARLAAREGYLIIGRGDS